MKKKTIRTIAVVALVFVFVLALGALTFAQAGDLSPLQKKVTDIKDGVQTVAGVIVVFTAVVTAIMYMASVVNPELRKQAKAGLVALIIGVVILALSGSAVDILNGLVNDKDLLTKAK